MALLCASPAICAQQANPSSALNPFFGSATAHPASSDLLRLSLDDAIALGLKNNLGLKEAEESEKAFQGRRTADFQYFLPVITLNGDLGVHQQNLAALGFGPATIKEFGSLLPPGTVIHEITRDDLTEGKIQYGQMLFSGPVIAAWKAIGAAERASHYAKMSARGEVVQQVATAYLYAIAAESEVDNARAQQATAEELLRQARAAHEAGVVAHLDELRAQLQLEAQQLALISAQNAHEKALILLKREIGIDPGEKILLSDPAPYSKLAAQTPEELNAVAYRNRQDYLTLQNQLVEMKAIVAAHRSQRLPSLSFGGYYGVSLVNDVGSHGNFAAQGTLSMPLFREAGLRGDIDAAKANVNAVNAQLDDLRVKIVQQVRSALLDVNASAKLVEVAGSNLDLATRALADESDRVNAGVDDNLPLVAAQATLASAESYRVESLYQYNLSKLALARAAGILESQYREYLGR